jgi:hypothetical protein
VRYLVIIIIIIIIIIVVNVAVVVVVVYVYNYRIHSLHFVVLFVDQILCDLAIFSRMGAIRRKQKKPSFSLRKFT